MGKPLTRESLRWWQLVLMGDRAIKPLVAYLEKEEALQVDIEAVGKRVGALGNGYKKYSDACQAFYNKWGNSPTEYEPGELARSRGRAVGGVIKALTLLGQNNFELFPHLMQKEVSSV